MDMSVTDLPGNVTRVGLDGRLDAQGADRVGLRFSAAVAAPGRNAIVDLSSVSFVASMGLRLLISTARALNQKGGKLVLFGATALVQEVLDDTALNQIIPIVATEADALAELASQQ